MVTMQYMKATKIIHDKLITQKLIIERVVWQLPKPTKERPHGLKYRLYCGNHAGDCLFRYDNEKGKGDHIHYGAQEVPYIFTTLTNLLLDFQRDINQITGDKP